MNILRPFEENRNEASPNRNISPLTTALDKEQKLNVGGCKLSSLAIEYGTPLYVLDELTIRTS